MLQWDEYWIAKVDQKTFSYDSIDCIVIFGFVEGDHDSVYIRIYELWCKDYIHAEYIFQGGHWIEDGWTGKLWMNIPDDMIKEIELLAKRFEKLKAFI